MTNRRYILFLVLLCAAVLQVSAVTQRGYVKTIARPDHPSERVNGVLIRVQGARNTVQSRDSGTFAILMPDLQNGDPYALSRVYISGYVPAEQELIGRQMPCSDRVPLVINLVNQQELLREKQAITERAMMQMEKRFAERNKWLEEQLAAKVLTEAEFNERLMKLTDRYDRFEPLANAMAETYARTDLDNLDELSGKINAAIEAGDWREAGRLMSRKDNLDKREQQIRATDRQLAAAQTVIDSSQNVLNERKRLNDAQRRELAEDLYRMYSICLMRFDNDSAGIYIERRAQLDTTNVDFQLQAGQYVRDMMADSKAAMAYFRRAYRIAESLYGEQSGQMSTVCHETGITYKLLADTTAAMTWLKRALSIRETIRGKESPAVAETLNSLGELYRMTNDMKRATECFKRSLKIREKHFGPNSLQAATGKNNLAYLYAKQGKTTQAERLFKQVYAILSNHPEASKVNLAKLLTNLVAVEYMSGNYPAAIEYAEQSVALCNKVLGERHPLTHSAIKMQQEVMKKSTEIQ